MEWQDALALPGTQALIMVPVAALLASYFFRAAWVLDDDERARVNAKTTADRRNARRRHPTYEVIFLYSIITLLRDSTPALMTVMGTAG